MSFSEMKGTAEISRNTELSKPLSSDTMVQNTRESTRLTLLRLNRIRLLYTAKKDFEKITAAKPPKE